MASPIDDPRYELARMMRSQRQGPASLPVLPQAPSKAAVQLGRTANAMASANPSLKAAIESIAAGKGAQEPKGVLGAVFANPLSKAILKPLEALTIPGRVTVAGLREAVDAIDQNPDTRASLSDFKKNVKDVSYGVGKAFNIDTGNIWVDRALGFVGDIATDPLTYVTFGAGKFAGYTGRLDLAKEILKTTGDARLANQVQRFGRAAVKDAELLERVGANRHGLYLLGKRVKVGAKQQGIRIPGTGAIGQLGDNMLSKLRISASQTKAGRWIQKMTLPSEGLAARQAMLQGQVGDEAAGALIGFFSASPVARRAAGEALQREQRAALNFLEAEKAAGTDGIINDLHKYIERPELLTDAAPEVRDAVGRWVDLFKRYEEDIDLRIQDIDPTHEFAFVQNYFPRIMTEDALRYRANAANPYAQSLNAIHARDPLEGGGNFKSRTLQPNDDWFGHKLTEEDLKSIDRLNDLAREHLGGANFFETDARVVLAKYVDSYAREVGVLARHKHLVDTGFWKRAEAVEVSGEFFDKELIDSMRKQVGSLTDDLRAAQKSAGEAMLELNNALNEAREGFVGRLKQLESPTGFVGERALLADTASAVDDVLNGALTISADKLQTVAMHLSSLKNKFAGMYGYEFKNGKIVLQGTDEVAPDAPIVLDGLLNNVDNIERDVQRLHDELWPLEQDWTGDELRAAQQKAAAELESAKRRLDAARDRFETVISFGNQLEGALTKISRGEEVGQVHESVAKVLAVLGRERYLGDKTVRNAAIEAVRGERGRVEQFFRNAINAPDSLFGRLTRGAKINKTDVIKMEPDEFYRRMSRMMVEGELDMSEIRTMGLYALINDDVIYGGKIPETLQTLRASLVDAMQRADDAQVAAAAFAKQQSAGGRLTANKLWESQWRGAYERARTADEELNELKTFLSAEGLDIRNNANLVDVTITADMAERMLKKYPYLQGQFGEMGSMEYIEDLMGVNMYTPQSRLEESYAGAAGGAADAAYRTNPTEQKTFADFIAGVEARVNELEQIMDEKVYQIGAGATLQEFSGREVVAKYSRYQELVSSLRSRRKMQEDIRLSILKERGYDDIDVSTDAGRQARAAIELEARTVAAQRAEKIDVNLGRKTYSDVQQELRELTGGGTIVRPEWMAGGDLVRQDLTSALMDYVMVSQVRSRFDAVASMLEPFGLAPTERMFSEIVNSVGAKFLPIFDEQIVTNGKAHAILTRLDGEMAVALREAKDSGVRATQIFQNFMKGLSDDERGILLDVVGNQIGWAGDPYELRRGLTAATKKLTGRERTAAENDYLNRFVKPWFESAYPGKTPFKHVMKTALKNASPSASAKARRALTSPFGQGADASTIKRWFEDLLGVSEIQGRGRPRVPTSVDYEGNITGMVSSAGVGTLALRVRRLRMAKSRLGSMLQPDVDIRQFMATPGVTQRTPSFYAQILRERADDLQARIDARLGMEAQGTEIQRLAGDAGETAEGYRTAVEQYQEGTAVPASLEKRRFEARGRGAAAGEARQRIQALEAEISSLSTEGRTLQNKARTVKGLTKKETARLNSVKKRVTAARAELKSVREQARNLPKVAPRDVALDIPAPVRLEPIASGAVADYQRKIGTVAYSKAVGDQEMINALEGLADFELWKFVDGFSSDGQAVATFKNGQKIAFSEEEWRSLYAGTINEEKRQAARQSLRSTRSEMKSLVAQRDALAQRISTVQQAMIDGFPSGRVSGAPRELRVRNAMKILENELTSLKSQLEDVQASLVMNQNVVDDLTMKLKVYAPGTRAAALEKMRILVQGRPGQPPVFNADGLARFKNFEHPTITSTVKRAHGSGVSVRDMAVERMGLVVDSRAATGRRQAIQRMWQASDEYKLLREVAGLESSVFVDQWRRMNSDVRALIAQRDELLSALAVHEGKLAEAGAAIVDEVSAAQGIAGRGEEALRARRNVGVVDESGEVVPTPETPEQMRQYADRLAEQAQPTGRLVTEGGEADAVGAAARDLVEADANRTMAARLSREAQAQLDEWARETGTPRLSGEMNRPSQARLGEMETGGPGQRQVLLKQARDAWSGRVKDLETAEQVRDAVVELGETVRTKMGILSGDVDNFWRELAQGRNVALTLEEQIAQVDMIIRSLPTDDAKAVIKQSMSGSRAIKQDLAAQGIKGKEAARIVERRIDAALRQYRAWMNENRQVLAAIVDNPDDPVAKALAAAAVADAKLIDLELTRAQRIQELVTASAGEWRTRVIQPLAEGWEKAAKETGMLQGQKSLAFEGLGGVYGNEEAVRLLQSIARIREPGVVNDLALFMRGYTGFFRSYATLSPGFHVRNTISNVFSIFAGGGDIANMREGFRMWRLFDDHLSKGGTLQSFIDTLPEEQRSIVRQAAEIVLGLGGGKTDDALDGFVRNNNSTLRQFGAGGRSGIRQNALIDTSRKFGHKVESSARFMMAYDSLMKGMDVNQSFNRTKRFLIDYNERTLMDNVMRDIVPFWTWMSRNLPLQIVNRWTNPKAYLAYEKFVRNFSQQEGEDGTVTPSWLSRVGAVNLGGGKFFNPDLPFSRIDEQITQLQNPEQLMNYVNPGIKVPLELLTNKSFFTGREFPDTYVPLSGKFAVLAPFFQAAGQLEYDANGEPVVTSKSMQAAMNLIPVLGRVERLVPSTEAGQSKLGNSINSFLGIPMTSVSGDAQDAERRRRLAELQALMNKRKAIEEAG